MHPILAITALTLVGFALILVDLMFIPGGIIIAIGSCGILYSIFLNYTAYGLWPALIHLGICLAAVPKLTIWSLGRVSLKNEMPASEGYVGMASRAHYIGSHGVAASDLRPAGTVRVDLPNPTFLDCVADGGYILKGDPVLVIEERGPSLVVRKY